MISTLFIATYKVSNIILYPTRFLQLILHQRFTTFAFGQNAEDKSRKWLGDRGLRKTGERTTEGESVRLIRIFL
jgi:hypothetical protein